MLRSSFFLPSSPLRQPYDASFFKALKWRNIGPNRGGRSIASAGSAARPLEYYFGATGGGLVEDHRWRHHLAAGDRWPDSRVPRSAPSRFRASNPDMVYIGMGESELRGNIMQGDGVYKSTDAGKTWKHIGPRRHAGHLAHPHSSHESRHRLRRGLRTSVRARIRSAASSARRMAAQTWQKVLFRDDEVGRGGACIDPQNPQVLYAAIWEASRTPWMLSSGGPGSGLFKSTDGGDHWTEITRNPGLPQGIIGKIGVAVSRRRLAIASTRMVESEDGGVFRSDDARRHLEAGQRGSQAAAARVLLLAHLRRPEERRTRSTC